MWETIVVGVIIGAAGVGVVRFMTQTSKAKSGCGGCGGCHEGASQELTKRDEVEGQACESQAKR